MTDLNDSLYGSWLAGLYRRMLADREITVQALVEETGLSRSTVNRYLSQGPPTARAQYRFEEAIDRITARSGGLFEITGSTDAGLEAYAEEMAHDFIRDLMRPALPVRGWQ